MTHSIAITAGARHELVLPEAALELVRHASGARGARAGVERAAFPSRREACGVLLGRRGPDRFVVERALELPNVAIGAERFEIEPQALAGVVLQCGAGAEELLGFWHTHPAGPAVPSRADRDGAWNDHLLLIAGRDFDVRAWWPSDAGFEEWRIVGDHP